MVSTIEETSLAQYDRMTDVMQRSVMLALKYGSQAMAVISESKPEPKGSFVITSSAAAFLPGWSDISYSTVKTAVRGLVSNGAFQLSSSNIRVNGIAPGATRSSVLTTSRFAESSQPYALEESTSDILKQHKMFCDEAGIDDGFYYHNRVANPEEIAHIGVFLISDLSSAINGQVILADSGKSGGALGETLVGRIPPVSPLELI